jgi:hypothetical protein
MNVIRFLTHLVSPLGTHEGRPRDGSGTWNAGRMVPAGRLPGRKWVNAKRVQPDLQWLKVLLWNCSSPGALRRRCLYAMRAIVRSLGGASILARAAASFRPDPDARAHPVEAMPTTDAMLMIVPAPRATKAGAAA